MDARPNAPKQMIRNVSQHNLNSSSNTISLSKSNPVDAFLVNASRIVSTHQNCDSQHHMGQRNANKGIVNNASKYKTINKIKHFEQYKCFLHFKVPQRQLPYVKMYTPRIATSRRRIYGMNVQPKLLAMKSLSQHPNYSTANQT